MTPAERNQRLTNLQAAYPLLRFGLRLLGMDDQPGFSVYANLPPKALMKGLIAYGVVSIAENTEPDPYNPTLMPQRYQCDTFQFAANQIITTLVFYDSPAATEATTATEIAAEVAA